MAHSPLVAPGRFYGAAIVVVLAMLVCAAILMLATVAWGLTPATVPDLTKFTLIGARPAFCPAGPILLSMYNEPGSDPNNAEIVTYGPDGASLPWLYMTWPKDTNGPPQHIILALPGKPVVELTLDELKAAYPGPCDLLLEPGKPI